MYDKTRELLASGILEAYESLNETMRDAGGVELKLERLKEMTMFEFLCHCAATNKIRFHYCREKKEKRF